MRDVLRSASMRHGALSVMMLGIAWMQMLHVDSLDIQDTV